MKLIVEDLSKDYGTFASLGERFLCAATLGLYSGSVKVRALRNINLEMGDETKGEIVGVIGPNGAGKSTLLRILSGNSRISSGRVRFQGSIRSILELGVGFSSELTGVENVYYNGRLWGYSGRLLMDSMDEIIDFEVENPAGSRFEGVSYLEPELEVTGK